MSLVSGALTYRSCCGRGWAAAEGPEDAAGGSRTYLEEGHLRDYCAFFLERRIYFRESAWVRGREGETVSAGALLSPEPHAGLIRQP